MADLNNALPVLLGKVCASIRSIPLTAASFLGTTVVAWRSLNVRVTCTKRDAKRPQARDNEQVHEHKEVLVGAETN